MITTALIKLINLTHGVLQISQIQQCHAERVDISLMDVKFRVFFSFFIGVQLFRGQEGSFISLNGFLVAVD